MAVLAAVGDKVRIAGIEGVATVVSAIDGAPQTMVEFEDGISAWYANRDIYPVDNPIAMPVPAPMPRVQGYCPSCGSQSLFLGDGGHITCSYDLCKDPAAVDDCLSRAYLERMKQAERGVSTRGYEIPSGLAGELKRWWLDQAEADYDATVPKMLEYGGDTHRSSDLEVMGDALIELLGWDAFALETRPVAQELGAWFYALGKTARLVTDYKQGRPGKADTWFDLTVYCMMARRIQQTGAWPGETT